MWESGDLDGADVVWIFKMIPTVIGWADICFASGIQTLKPIGEKGASSLVSMGRSALPQQVGRYAIH